MIMIDDPIYLRFHPDFLISLGQRHGLKMVLPWLIISSFWIGLDLHVYLRVLVVIGESNKFLFGAVIELSGCDVLLG